MTFYGALNLNLMMLCYLSTIHVVLGKSSVKATKLYAKL